MERVVLVASVIFRYEQFLFCSFALIVDNVVTVYRATGVYLTEILSQNVLCV